MARAPRGRFLAQEVQHAVDVFARNAIRTLKLAFDTLEPRVTTAETDIDAAEADIALRSVMEADAYTAVTNWSNINNPTLIRFVVGSSILVVGSSTFVNGTGGAVANGTQVGQLPAGYRPAAAFQVPSYSGSPAGASRLAIGTGGSVTLKAQPAGNLANGSGVTASFAFLAA
jgi:hypothetical protein